MVRYTDLLGALLRLTHQTILRDISHGLAETGYDDLQPAHYSVTQALWDRSHGARLTELAAAARITKQSMGALVDHLQARGYVDRVTDPGDGRATLTRFTDRGWALARLARTLARRVEARCEDRIGAKRIHSLKETLQLLIDHDREGTDKS